jgi:predicted transposase YbfD/YdcC
MDEHKPIEQLKVLLAGIGDPRDRRGRLHEFVDILFIALSAMLAGADDAEAIEDFGDAHEEWLRQFLELPNGIPTQDTYLRVFAAIDPKAMQSVFREWVTRQRATSEVGHIAIDGKTLRRSFNAATGGKAIHMVSAWLADEGLVLGQLKTGEKSNEITAIPELLRLLDVRGATVTIDAMGCQRAIAEQIVDSGAHYALAVKDNQPTLCDNIRGFFQDAQRLQRPVDDPAPVLETMREADGGHGRVEERTCWLSRDLSWVENRPDWKGLAAIALVRSERHELATQKSSTEERVFILSDPNATAAAFLRTVRNHWGVENKLHWVLDMTFGEDANRTRIGNAAANLAVLRHVTLNLLRGVPDKRSVRKRRQRCGWDLNYLSAVLIGRKPE